MLATRQLLGRASKVVDQVHHHQGQVTLAASICHKSQLPENKIKPWPYENRGYGLAHLPFDPFTKRRFNENSKIIQIEGNVHSGKKDFAQRLADELGMKLMPDIDLDSYYTNKQGFDYRALNPLLPERLRNCDWPMWHQCPNRHSVVHMQFHLSKLRFEQYLLALQHLFNTGQGVIMTRSYFTEIALVEAMDRLAWLPKGYLREDGIRFYDWMVNYKYRRNLTCETLLKPHLTLYLETPVDTCMDRIRKSQNPMIAGSQALVPEFLKEIENVYEEVVLPRATNYSRIIRVDHNERKTDDEMADVIDEICQHDYDFVEYDTLFVDWDSSNSHSWHTTQRLDLCSDAPMSLFYKYNTVPHYDIAGLGDSITAVDLELRRSLMEAHAGPLGYLCSAHTDPRYRGYLGALLGTESHKARLERSVRADFP